MRVLRKEIHPQLRLTGTLLRLALPRFTPGFFRFGNAVLDRLGRGHAFTRRVRYAQVSIPREDGSLLRLCVYRPRDVDAARGSGLTGSGRADKHRMAEGTGGAPDPDMGETTDMGGVPNLGGAPDTAGAPDMGEAPNLGGAPGAGVSSACGNAPNLGGAPNPRGVPGLLWLHGGGYAMGIPEQNAAAIARLVEASGCVAVAPDYTRSTEAPYPAALDDCWRALVWLRDNAAALGVRDDQLFVAGDSAGGGLTAALTLLARDRGTVSVAFQMPLYPMLDDRMQTESMRDNDAPVWNAASNAAAWGLYLGDAAGGPDVSPYAAPGRAVDLRGLPPTLTFAGGVEPFRDEIRAYVTDLEAAGVPVEFREFPGCFHAFDTVAGHTPVGREAQAFVLNGFLRAVRGCFKAQPKNKK